MNFGEEKEKSLQDLVTIFATALRRYWRIAIPPAIVIACLCFLFALKLPNTYSADFLIYIQPQRIPSKMIEAPDSAEMRERLEAHLQEILSRPRLRAIIEQFGLYPDLQGPIGKTKAVEEFRKAIKIGPAESATGTRLAQTFRIRYSHEDPQLAFEVAQAISDLFIEESLVTRRSETQGTEEFFDAELLAAKKKLETTEGRVRDFVSANFEQLPENIDAAIARLENAQSQLRTNSQLISASQMRLENLRRDYGTEKTTGAVLTDPTGGANSADPVERLAQLESALQILKGRYSNKHPDVVATKKRIASLKAQVGKSGRKGSKSIRGESGIARGIRREIDDTGVKIAALEQENSDLKQEISSLESNIKIMPVRDEELKKIRRDYNNDQANYQRLLEAKESASLQSNLVKSQKASQFRIVEPAERSHKPTGPNRPLLLGAGLLLSILAGLAIPMLAFLTNGAFKFTGDLEDELGVEVIGVVPVMNSPQQAVENRRVVGFCSFFSLLVLAGGSALIMTFI